jgi:hypothetical protein
MEIGGYEQARMKAGIVGAGLAPGCCWQHCLVGHVPKPRGASVSCGPQGPSRGLAGEIPRRASKQDADEGHVEEHSAEYKRFAGFRCRPRSRPMPTSPRCTWNAVGGSVLVVVRLLGSCLLNARWPSGAGPRSGISWPAAGIRCARARARLWSMRSEAGKGTTALLDDCVEQASSLTLPGR